jgi:fibronectin-binding autotransporter adhesin
MKKLLPLGLALAAVLTGTQAHAANATWTGSSDGNWVTSGSENNWSGGVATFPGAQSGTTNTDTATFLSGGATTVAINSSTVNLRQITFGASTGALSSYTIGSTSSGGSLVLTSGGQIAFVNNSTATNITETINAPILLEGSYTFTNANASATNVLNIGGTVTNATSSGITLTLGASGGNNTGLNVVSGNISDGSAGGTTGINANAGAWALSGSNSFSGGVSINRGTLGINSSHALGTGTLTLLNAGNFDNTSGSAVTLATNNVVNLNGAETFFGTNSLNLGTGNFVLGQASTTLTISSNTLTIGGVMSGAASGDGFTKNGAGTLVMTGSNTYNGATTISAGVVNYQNGTAFGTNSAITESAASTTVQVQGGITGGTQTLTLNGTGAAGATGALENVSGSNSYSGNIVLTAGSTISSDSGTLTLQTGVISGAQGITKAGNGTLILSGVNTYTGSSGSNGTIVSAGTLIANGSVASGAVAGVLGTGALFLGDANTTANNSSAALLTGGAFTIARGISVNNDATSGTYSLGGATDNSSTFSGVITTSQNLSITQVATTGSDALNITGGIKGATGTAKTISFANVGAVNVTTTAISDGTSPSTLAVVQAGSGTTTLAAANTYTGGTTVKGGNLVLNGSTSATGTFNVGGISGGLGTATLSGTGTVNGLLVTSSTNGNVAHIAPGATPATVGTLHVGNIGFTIGSGTNFDYDINTGTAAGGTTNDLIAMTGGTLTIGGTGIVFNFDQLSGLTAGTAYTLISGATSVSGFSASDFSATGDTGYTAAFNNTGTAITVTFTAAGGGSPNYYFTGSNSGSFTDAGNYFTAATGGTQQSTALSSTSNVFLNANTATNTPDTLNTSASINSLNFVTAGTSLAGSGTVTLAATGTAGITDSASTLGQTETVAPAVVLGSNQSWAATTNSTLNVTGAISGPQSLAVTGNGTYKFAGSNTFQGLTVGTGSDTPTLYLTNGTSGSATGTTTLRVNAGATLAGNGTSSGTSFNISGTGTATGARANVLVGLTSAIDTTVGNKLSLIGSTGTSTIADANLTFNLSATSTASNQLSVGATNIGFGTDNKSVLFSLNLQGEPAIVPNGTLYTLIAGIGSTSTGVGSSTGQYTGLTLGNSTTVGGVTETIITGNNLQVAFGSSVDTSYYGNGSYLVLYQSAGVDDIDVVVVPEPGTWAMMLGGLALLVFWQRRKAKRD